MGSEHHRPGMPSSMREEGGTLVECEEDFVKLVNVRPYAAVDRYVASQHIVWVNRQPR